MKYKNPALAVDIIIEKDENIILITRKHEPYANSYALPGGFVEYGEVVEDTAVREAYEETHLKVQPLEILGCYSSPDRDPRKHVISIVFIAKTNDKLPQGGDDAKTANFYPLKDVVNMKLAFDHKQIIEDYLRWKETRETFWSTKERKRINSFKFQ